MNDKSKRKRALPKGLVDPGSTKGFSQKSMAADVANYIDSISTMSLIQSGPEILERSPYLICRAYSEPDRHNLIEEMLFQREYIID